MMSLAAVLERLDQGNLGETEAQAESSMPGVRPVRSCGL